MVNLLSFNVIRRWSISSFSDMVDDSFISSGSGNQISEDMIEDHQRIFKRRIWMEHEGGAATCPELAAAQFSCAVIYCEFRGKIIEISRVSE